MAHDGQFFRFAERIQPVFHTPSGALVFQGCVAVMLVLTGRYEELYSLMIFTVWIFFVLTAVALIRLRRKEPTLLRPYRAWGYPWTPLIFAAAAFAMTANLWLIRPMRSSIGLAVILLGVPFFYYWRRRAAIRSACRICQSSGFLERGRRPTTFGNVALAWDRSVPPDCFGCD